MSKTNHTFEDWHAIQTLIMQTSHLVDAGRFAEASALFEHGAVHQVFDPASGTAPIIFEGKDGARRWMDKTPLFADGTPRTRHVCTNLIVEFAGEKANSRCYFTVFQQTPTLPLQAIAAGRYEDSFERADGRWRFTKRVITGFLTGDISQHAHKK